MRVVRPMNGTAGRTGWALAGVPLIIASIVAGTTTGLALAVPVAADEANRSGRTAPRRKQAPR